MRMQIVESYHRSGAGSPSQRVTRHLGTHPPGAELGVLVRDGEYQIATLAAAAKAICRAPLAAARPNPK